jgi:hypothetical protein
MRLEISSPEPNPYPPAFHSPSTSLLCRMVIEVNEILVRFGAAFDKLRRFGAPTRAVGCHSLVNQASRLRL